MQSDASAKKCTKCGETKPATAFSRNARAKDGLQSKCKACDAAYHAAHRPRNIARMRVYNASVWIERHEEMLAKAVVYRATHPDRVAVAHAKWYASHKEEVAVYGAGYHSTHPEVARLASHRHRARKLNAPGAHTAQDIQNIYNEQDGLCFWCDCELGGDYHVDHLYPLSKGGGDGPENIALTCPTCNLRKHAKDPEVFLEQVLAA